MLATRATEAKGRARSAHQAPVLAGSAGGVAHLTNEVNIFANLGSCTNIARDMVFSAEFAVINALC